MATDNGNLVVTFNMMAGEKSFSSIGIYHARGYVRGDMSACV